MTVSSTPVFNALADLGLSSQVQPAVQSEVDALRTIEPKVKPGMVSHGVRDNKLALVLNQGIRPAGRLSEKGGGGKEGFVSEKLRAVLNVLREVTYDNAFSIYPCRRKDAAYLSWFARAQKPYPAEWRTKT